MSSWVCGYRVLPRSDIFGNQRTFDHISTLTQTMLVADENEQRIISWVSEYTWRHASWMEFQETADCVAKQL